MGFVVRVSCVTWFFCLLGKTRALGSLPSIHQWEGYMTAEPVKMSPIVDDLFFVNQLFGEVLLAAKKVVPQSSVRSVVFWIVSWTRFIKLTIVRHQFLRA